MKRSLRRSLSSASPEKKARQSGAFTEGLTNAPMALDEPEQKAPGDDQEATEAKPIRLKPPLKHRGRPVSIESIQAGDTKRERPTSIESIQASDTKRDSLKKAKKIFTSSEIQESEATSLNTLSTKSSKDKPTPRKSAINYRGLGINGDQGQRATATALNDAREKRIRIVQFGGGTGSNAGDAALTSFLRSRRRAATDLGGGSAQSKALTSEATKIKEKDPEDSDHSEAESASESEDIEIESTSAKKQQNAEELIVLSKANEAEANKKSSKQLLIVTHWHKDHAGDPKTLWQSEPATKNIATILGSKGATKTDPQPTLIYGQREPTTNYAKLASNMPKKQVTTNGEKLFAWKTKPGKMRRDLPKPGELRVEGRAIRPPDVTLKKADNPESLGVLTMVDKYGDSGAKERLFTMVSLGDMEGVDKAGGQDVARRVKAAQDTYSKDIPIDVVKISHHGSENNLDVVPEGLIGKETIVVISGYTKTNPTDLLKKIEGWAAKKVVLLVQDDETLDILKQMGGAWKRLEAKVTVANDLVMTVDDDGSVNIEATKVV